MAGHEELFLVGSTFSPQDHELINQFLRQKIAGADLGRFSSFIHEADVYSAPPGDLIENRAHAPGSDKDDGKGGVWYFFSPVRRHQTKGGCSGRRQRVVDDDEGYNWHSEKSEPVLDTQGKRVGFIDKLSFGIKRPGAARTRLGWCMKEYGLDHDDEQDGAAGLVLCKIYVSPHKREITYASVINAPGSKKKRKAAADVQHPEAPRPKTPRRQEMSIQEEEEEAGGTLREFERSFMSDQDETLPPGVADDCSVDPSGFFTDMLPELGLTLQGNTEASEHGSDCTLEESLAGEYGDVHQDVETAEEDDGTFQCTWEEMFGDNMEVACPAPPTASLHVRTECACV
ncbi:uncharacterized protein [Triticum aestivum]|uniref:uncharacterized protein n=1 Tax=Triticum aestivum TaxID=4565 RepID=UPI001D01A948|nr:uncharacterized protein LOC123107090 [Triticum aestivum]